MRKLKLQLPPQSVTVAYLTPGNYILITTAHRKRRTWKISEIQKIPSDNLFEFTTRLKEPKKTFLIGIIPRSLYHFTRSIYPSSLKNNLNEIIQYYKDENVLFKNDCFYITSTPLTDESGILAPALSLKKSTYERIIQMFNANSFKNYLIIPDTYIVESFLKQQDSIPYHTNTWILQKGSEKSMIAIQSHVPTITESITVNPYNRDMVNLFRQKLNMAEKVIGISDSSTFFNDITAREIDIVVNTSDFFKQAVSGLLNYQKVDGFDSSVRLNFPKIPRTLFIPLLGIMLVVATGIYVHSTVSQTRNHLAMLKAEKRALEQKWSPIENQQKMIDKLEEDKRNLQITLSQGIPLLKVLEVLTQTTPQDTWLNYLVINSNNTMFLRGESGSAVRYVSALSKIPGFKNVSFASPVRKNTRTQKEYFNIKLVVDWNEFMKKKSENRQ